MKNITIHFKSGEPDIEYNPSKFDEVLGKIRKQPIRLSFSSDKGVIDHGVSFNGKMSRWFSYDGADDKTIRSNLDGIYFDLTMSSTELNPISPDDTSPDS